MEDCQTGEVAMTRTEAIIAALSAVTRTHRAFPGASYDRWKTRSDMDDRQDDPPVCAECGEDLEPEFSDRNDDGERICSDCAGRTYLASRPDRKEEL